MIVLQIVFWLCLVALLHSYIIYPLLLRILAAGKQMSVPRPLSVDAAPTVFVLVAAYNEASVIAEKIENLLDCDYPKKKLYIWVGSDNSTDGTNEILADYALRYPQVNVHVFKTRTGKIGIQNQLVQALNTRDDDVLLFTDADVLLAPDTITKLVERLQDERIGLVGANPQSKSAMVAGVSKLENTYIKGESSTKYFEGLLWGTMMGAFGACYAMRANLYKPVPTNFKVDDFYITMSVLKTGHYAVKLREALCFEDSPDSMQEEFRRKVRISTGNFQNLRVFSHLIWPPYKPLGFSFLSHKVLRWFGPFFIIGLLTTNIALLGVNAFYALTFIVQYSLLFLTLIEIVLRKSGVHSIPLRFVTYFYYMNLALLVGFYKFLKGEQSNVWEPTKRK